MVTLTLLGPGSEHQQWQFEVRASVKVGRALDNDVVLANEQVSRYHLELTPTSSDLDSDLTQKKWRLQGLGTNGTLVNEKFVTQADILHGDLIQLGLSGPVLRFELRSSDSRECADFCSQSLEEEQKSAVTCAHQNNEPGNQFCIHCGDLLQARERVGHYQVIQTLESRERETTFLAKDIAERAFLYVIRRFQPAMFLQAQAQFEQEVLRLRAFNHPGVVGVVDFLFEEPYRYVVLDHIAGVSLQQWVRLEKPTVPTAIKILLSIGDSLEALHSHMPPIVHHNLSPSTILVRRQGEGTVLTHFGSLRAAGLGILASVPPTVQSDLYRLGTTLLFMVTGQEPSQCINVRRSGQHIEWRTQPQVPFSLRLVIERMTHPDLQYRYHTVAESMEDLRICQSELA